MDPAFTTPQIAHLDRDKLQKVEDLERQLGGAIVIAYDQPVVPAELTPEQVAILQRLERELGVCLVAYRKPG